jgi:oxygen-independent coproporphyrinogen III oxidase
MESMVDAMCREMEMRVQGRSRPKISTVYFGGGTPSILPETLLGKLFDAIHHHYEVDPVAEITLEANPDDMSDELISAWKRLGINRLSIGLQSSHNDRLSWMNRVHSAEEGRHAVRRAQDAGISNISLDLMYNFPGSTIQELDEDIQSIQALSPKHISAYGLTIEPQTVFGKRLKKGELLPLPEEQAVQQFQFVRKKLAETGFEGYEISNFGQPGFFAVHNTNYWFQKSYDAIGPGAHGFDGIQRTENLPNNSLYIKSILEKGALYQKVEILTVEDRANEHILTRLRTKWGLDLNELNHIGGFSLDQLKEKEMNAFEKEGLIYRQNQVIFLTEEGKLLADRITMELMI